MRDVAEQIVKKGRDTRPVFLYPHTKQYPFDEAAGRVVRELESRGFRVPGLEVRFDVYGSGAQRMRMVREIRGEDFRVYFSRVQNLMPGGHYNDTAGVNTLTVGKFSLSVYEDYSGPSFVVYVGRDWEADREKFLKGYNHPVNSKLRNERRIALKYKGAFYPPGHPKEMYDYRGALAPYLKHDTDLDREYTPLPLGEGESPSGAWRFVNDERVAAGPPDSDAPFCLSTTKVMAYFKDWIEGTLLPRIMKEPLRDADPALFAEESPVPFPPDVHLFTYAAYEDVRRIRLGQADPASPDLKDRDFYGMKGDWRNSGRLLPVGTKDDGTFPKKVYDGFMWCGFGEPTPETYYGDLTIPNFDRHHSEPKFVVRLKPKSAHGIYVADWGAYESARNAYFEAREKGHHASDGDAGEWLRAAARTFVPLAEYRGGYSQPVALVDCDRELGFDEVEIVSGPWRYHMEKGVREWRQEKED